MGCSGRESDEGKSTVTTLAPAIDGPRGGVSIYGVKLSAQALKFVPHGRDTGLNFLDMGDARNIELGLSISTRPLKTGVQSV